MRTSRSTFIRTVGLCALGTVAAPFGGLAQWPTPAPAMPNDQRNMLNSFRTELNLFQNVTSSAPNYGANGYGNLMGHFQSMRGAFSALKGTLNPRQLERGANSCAELEAGLDILGEAFSYYVSDVQSGRPENAALRDCCQVLRQGSQVWEQEFNKVARELRIGIG